MIPNARMNPWGCRNIPQRNEAIAAEPSDPRGVLNQRTYGANPGRMSWVRMRARHVSCIIIVHMISCWTLSSGRRDRRPAG